MFTQIRIAIGLALTAIFLTSLAAFAKGGFDFVMISGPNLKESVRLTDTRFTADFFTFANFYEDKTEAPADPGTGYEITRHYVQGVSDVIFDRLHYYPEAGLVFYDGIENGESEYDGEWYTANPEIKPLFESALSMRSTDKAQPGTSAGSAVQPQSVSSLPFAALAMFGMAVVLLFAYRLRKSISR